MDQCDTYRAKTKGQRRLVNSWRRARSSHRTVRESGAIVQGYHGTCYLVKVATSTRSSVNL